MRRNTFMMCPTFVFAVAESVDAYNSRFSPLAQDSDVTSVPSPFGFDYGAYAPPLRMTRAVDGVPIIQKKRASENSEAHFMR